MKRLLGAVALCPLLVASFAKPAHAQRLNVPVSGRIEVAVLVSDGAVMIDFAGPWEVFSDVMLRDTGKSHEQIHPFHLYTVAERKAPIHVSGGMQIIPDYSFSDAPTPNVVVIPAQDDDSPRVLSWIRSMRNRDVVMSVCTGAFLLAKAGVLDDKAATTHHGAYVTLSRAYPKISVERQKRYVQADSSVFTSGGLSAGIDLALHVVELYFGRDTAAETARHMEYEGTDWAAGGDSAVNFSPTGLRAEMDDLTNQAFGNPSTAFTMKGRKVEFSFGGDPAFQGTVEEGGRKIRGTLLMSDGKTADLTWTRVEGQNDAAGLGQDEALVVGEWWSVVVGPRGRQEFLLHIRE